MTTRKFRVTVDGETLEVEVEELASPDRPLAGRPTLGQAGGAVSAAWGPPPPPGPLPPSGGPPRPGQPAPAGRQAAGNGEKVTSPLPGTVVSIAVAPGQTVKTGSVLLVIEAMKMQNEIASPRDGKVLEVAVSQGATVGAGDLLLTLE
jgi:biotin carboxyl carrier protein